MTRQESAVGFFDEWLFSYAKETMECLYSYIMEMFESIAIVSSLFKSSVEQEINNGRQLEIIRLAQLGQNSPKTAWTLSGHQSELMVWLEESRLMAISKQPQLRA